MRSPADGFSAPTGSGGWRPAAELALRVVALGALLLVLLRMSASSDGERVERATGARATEALARWSTDPTVASGHLSFTNLPERPVRSWMRALGAAGVPVSYDSPAWPALALSVNPVPDPMRASRVRVAAPAGSGVALSDAIGPLDTLVAVGAGAELEVAAPSSPLVAMLPGVTATAPAADSIVLRPILVIGQAGWETKFTVAALEERGWTVVSRMAVAPDVDVTHGPIPPLDTARLAAVVVLDASAERLAPAIVRYLRSGGGVVLGADAGSMGAFRTVAAGRPGTPLLGSNSELRGASPRAGLPLVPITSLAADAVVLESRGGSAAVAARRVGAGRLVQSGYEESWRWRMAGPEGAPEEHRRWWAGLVASVAYAPRAAAGDAALATGAAGPTAASILDGAPLAGLIDAVGEPAAAPAGAAPAEQRPRMPWWAMAVATVALLMEWGSRRLRGAR